MSKLQGDREARAKVLRKASPAREGARAPESEGPPRRPTWEATDGVLLVDAGKRRNGRPHSVMMVRIYVCFSAADAKAMAKVAPSLRWVERERCIAKPVKSEDKRDE